MSNKVVNVNNTGALSITGGANTVTIASAVGMSSNAFQAKFSSGVHAKSVLTGPAPATFNGEVTLADDVTVTGDLNDRSVGETGTIASGALIITGVIGASNTGNIIAETTELLGQVIVEDEGVDF